MKACNAAGLSVFSLCLLLRSVKDEVQPDEVENISVVPKIVFHGAFGVYISDIAFELFVDVVEY